jgi:hypothetical protein
VKLVYVAGPYRAKNVWEVTRNIERAKEWGAEIAALGAMPVIPHANTALFDGIQSDRFWLDGTLELMLRCDAVYAMNTWQESTGAREEVRRANLIELPVFTNLGQMAGWLESFRHGS